MWPYRRQSGEDPADLVAGQRDQLLSTSGAGCYNRSMSMFRRKPRQPKYGPETLKMRPVGSRWVGAKELKVSPLARGRLRVFLQMWSMNGSCGYYLTEDEVRRFAQALFDGIDQSKALTAGESG
jgi:hypothetical protein